MDAAPSGGPTFACVYDPQGSSAGVRWFAEGFCGALGAAGLRQVGAADAPDLILEVLEGTPARHAAHRRPGAGAAAAVTLVRTPVDDADRERLFGSARPGLETIILVVLAPGGTEAWLARPGGAPEHIGPQGSDDLFLARLRDHLLDAVRGAHGSGTAPGPGSPGRPEAHPSGTVSR